MSKLHIRVVTYEQTWLGRSLHAGARRSASTPGSAPAVRAGVLSLSDEAQGPADFAESWSAGMILMDGFSTRLPVLITAAAPMRTSVTPSIIRDPPTAYKSRYPT